MVTFCRTFPNHIPGFKYGDLLSCTSYYDRVYLWSILATGFLYWCVCWWRGLVGPATGEPHFPDVPIVLKDRSSTLVDLGVNGDGILVWPGPDMTPYPSLRLEVVRDGIEDYEYLALLERCIEIAGPRPDLLADAALALERAGDPEKARVAWEQLRNAALAKAPLPEEEPRRKAEER